MTAFTVMVSKSVALVVVVLWSQRPVGIPKLSCAFEGDVISKFEGGQRAVRKIIVLALEQ